MQKGQNIINFLISKVNESDPSASSHWKKYHSNFKVYNGIPSGIEGFGSNEKSYRGFNLILHFIFQLRYRLTSFKSLRMFIYFLKFDYLNFKILKNQDKGYSIDCLRQTLTLSYIYSLIPKIFNSESTIWVIGDGFASMTNLLYKSNSCKNIVLINLTKTLLVDVIHIKNTISNEEFNNNVILIENKNDFELFSKSENTKKNIFLIEARNYSLLEFLKPQLVINIVSMQEMNNETIKEYFQQIQKNNNTYFYCCNRKEKKLPDGTITRIDEYPWKINDLTIIDELCPWHQSYYKFRFPFFYKYDGPISHQIRLMNYKYE